MPRVSVSATAGYILKSTLTDRPRFTAPGLTWRSPIQVLVEVDVPQVQRTSHHKPIWIWNLRATDMTSAAASISIQNCCYCFIDVRKCNICCSRAPINNLPVLCGSITNLESWWCCIQLERRWIHFTLTYWKRYLSAGSNASMFDLGVLFWLY